MTRTLTGPVWKRVSKFYKEVVRVPHKPSLRELELYENYIKKIAKEGKKTALVLGATPGIRDILAKYNFDVVLLDINPAMVKAMTSIMKRKKIKEKIVIGNWLKNPLHDNTFDVVLADHSCSNIKFEKWDKFFKQINRVLKPNGYHIHNVVLSLNDGLLMEQFIEKYRRNPEFFKNYHNLVWYHYRVWTHDPRFYNSKTHESDWGKFDKALKKKVSAEDFEKMKQGLGNFKVYFPTKKIAEKLLKEYFKIINIKYNKEHPVFKRYQLYLLKNKK